MTNVLATCPACGTQDVDAGLIRAVRCSVPAWSYFSFSCPGCGAQVRKDATAAVLALLARVKVPLEPWHVPQEAVERHEGPPIGYDDLLDFVLELRREDLTGELLVLHR